MTNPREKLFKILSKDVASEMENFSRRTGIEHKHIGTGSFEGYDGSAGLAVYRAGESMYVVLIVKDEDSITSSAITLPENEARRLAKYITEYLDAGSSQ